MFLAPRSIGTIVYVLLFTAAYADEAHDNIAARWRNSVVTQCDAGLGSRLSCYGSIRRNVEIGFQFNDTCHVEDNGTRTALL